MKQHEQEVAEAQKRLFGKELAKKELREMKPEQLKVYNSRMDTLLRKMAKSGNSKYQHSATAPTKQMNADMEQIQSIRAQLPAVPPSPPVPAVLIFSPRNSLDTVKPRTQARSSNAITSAMEKVQGTVGMDIADRTVTMATSEQGGKIKTATQKLSLAKIPSTSTVASSQVQEDIPLSLTIGAMSALEACMFLLCLCN